MSTFENQLTQRGRRAARSQLGRLFGRRDARRATWGTAEPTVTHTGRGKYRVIWPEPVNIAGIAVSVSAIVSTSSLSRTHITVLGPRRRIDTRADAENEVHDEQLMAQLRSQTAS